MGPENFSDAVFADRFFRRYGLEDVPTIVLDSILAGVSLASSVG